MTNANNQLVSQLLPFEARMALMQFSQIEWPSKRWGESLKRQIALESATARIKRAYPQFFQQEK